MGSVHGTGTKKRKIYLSVHKQLIAKIISTRITYINKNNNLNNNRINKTLTKTIKKVKFKKK